MGSDYPIPQNTSPRGDFQDRLMLEVIQGGACTELHIEVTSDVGVQYSCFRKASTCNDCVT
jgi:hypothetical protein